MSFMRDGKLVRLFWFLFFFALISVSTVLVIFDYCPIATIPVLRYEYIGNDQPKNPFAVSNDNFIRQMQFLKDGEYNVVDVETLVKLLKSKELLPRNTIVLTFDVGYESCTEFIQGQLSQHRFKGAFFFSTDLLDQDGYLTKAQLKKIASNNTNITIASYGKRPEVDMSRMSESDVYAQAFTSRSVLTEILEKKIFYFAYPNGKYSAVAMQKVKEIGYKAGFALMKGKSYRNIYAIRRVPIMAKDNFMHFKLKCWGNYLWVKDWWERHFKKK